jgi:hypothetical protein
MHDFDTSLLHRFVPGISGEIRSGQMRPRWDRMAKNSRWYLVGRSTLVKIGWGDLAAADLDVLAEHLGGGAAFVALRENPRGGQHLPHPADEPWPGWCWYDRPDCNPITVVGLAASATFAVINNTVFYVTTGDDPEVSLTLGIDTGHHGLVDAPRHYPAIRPDELAERLGDLLGPLPGNR